MPGACLHRYEVQRARHEEVLSSFQANLDLLARLEVHPSAQRPGLRHLADVVPEPRLREWAARCSASHRSLAAKVRPVFFRPSRPVPASVRSKSALL